MRRRSLLTAAVAAPIATAAAVGGLQVPAQAATWSSSDQWGNWQTGPYTIYNNIWGSGAGSQSIWANSHSNWGVWADHPNTGGIKSYPNVSYTLGRNVSNMGNVSSSHNVTVPSGSGLAYNTAYDVWGDGHAHEIMIWTQWTSNVGPLGSFVTDVNLGGRNWRYYQGHNGGNPVYSFLAHSQTTSSTVNITAHCQWLVNQGRLPNVRIDQIQFGWEITSSAGGRDFRVNNYSLST
ncbi:glycoside hydrolase family 12 protein [Glycomyces tarimensis]